MAGGNAEVPTGSAFTACAVPHKNPRVCNHVFIVQVSSQEVLTGATFAESTPRVALNTYDRLSDVGMIVRALSERYYLKIYPEPGHDGSRWS